MKFDADHPCAGAGQISAGAADQCRHAASAPMPVWAGGLVPLTGGAGEGEEAVGAVGDG